MQDMALQIGHWHVPLRPGCASGGCWVLLGAAGRRAEILPTQVPDCFQRYLAWRRCNDLQAGPLPRSSRAVHDRGASGASLCRFFFCFSSLTDSIVNRFSLAIVAPALGPILGRFHIRCAVGGSSSHLLESPFVPGILRLAGSRGVVGCGVGGRTPQGKDVKRPIANPSQSRPQARFWQGCWLGGIAIPPRS